MAAGQSASGEIAAHVRENSSEHFGCENARVRVVARAMVTIEQAYRSRVMLGTVTERGLSRLEAKCFDGGVMRHAAEHDDRAQISHFVDSDVQKRAAGVDLGRQGLVLRRNAAHAVADAAVNEGQSIVGPRFIRSSRKAEFDECAVKKIAGEIARKMPPRAVGTLKAEQAQRSEAVRLPVRKTGPAR